MSGFDEGVKGTASSGPEMSREISAGPFPIYSNRQAGQEVGTASFHPQRQSAQTLLRPTMKSGYNPLGSEMSYA